MSMIEKINKTKMRNIGREKGPRNEELYTREEINPLTMDIINPIKELKRDMIVDMKEEKRYRSPCSSSDRNVDEISFPQLRGFRYPRMLYRIIIIRPPPLHPCQFPGNQIRDIKE